MIRSIREFSSVEQAIANGIGRGLAYKQIAALPEVQLSIPSVRLYVSRMAASIEMDDDGELAPRQKLFAWVKHQEWEASYRARRAKRSA